MVLALTLMMDCRVLVTSDHILMDWLECLEDSVVRAGEMSMKKMPGPFSLSKRRLVGISCMAECVLDVVSPKPRGIEVKSSARDGGSGEGWSRVEDDCREVEGRCCENVDSCRDSGVSKDG